MIERRKTPRLRTLLGARACFNQRNATLDCVVRNFSEDGALLVVSDAVALPSAFEIDIAQRQRSYAARVRWREGSRVGVAFETRSPESEMDSSDLARRLRHVEQANVRLKTRISQLTEAS